MQGKFKAFMYWYIMDKYGSTQYIYVISVSEKQANYFWFRYLHNVLGNVFDYCIDPCNEIECKYIHSVGDVLGQNALI